MKTGKKSPIFDYHLWIALLIGLAGLTILLQIKHKREKAKLLIQIGDLRSSLNQSQKPLKRSPGLNRWDLEKFQRKGLKNPLKEIVADLQKHPELIPYEGVNGGKMGFYSADIIWVLSNRWVFAYFEDGHRGGWMLLEFRVSSDGKISWKVLESYLD